MEQCRGLYLCPVSCSSQRTVFRSSLSCDIFDRVTGREYNHLLLSSLCLRASSAIARARTRLPSSDLSFAYGYGLAGLLEIIYKLSHNLLSSYLSPCDSISSFPVFPYTLQFCLSQPRLCVVYRLSGVSLSYLYGSLGRNLGWSLRVFNFLHFLYFTNSWEARRRGFNTPSPLYKQTKENSRNETSNNLVNKGKHQPISVKTPSLR